MATAARAEPEVGMSASGGKKHDDDDVSGRRRRVSAGRGAQCATVHRLDRRQHLGTGHHQRQGVVHSAAAAESFHPTELPAELLYLLRDEPPVPGRVP